MDAGPPNRQGGFRNVTVATTSTASTIPSITLAQAITALQQATVALTAAVQQLQAALGFGASAGAATLGTTATDSSTAGAVGALGGVDQLGESASTDTPEETEQSDTPEQTAKSDTTEKTDKADSSSKSDLGSKLVAEGKKHLGKKYVWAAAGPNTFDCSGFTQYVAKHFGINLPHKASLQAKKGTAVAKKDLQAGDLVFFRTGRGISHVGMYVGDGKIIEAAGKGKDVRISKLSGSWYSQHYAGARRLSK